MCCLYQNVRGIGTKLQEFSLSVNALTSDVILLTETWLHSGIHSSELGIPGFNVYRKDRSGETSTKSRGGGVLIAVRKRFKSKQIMLKRDDVEQIFVVINSSKEKIVFGCVYIPPLSPAVVYEHHFSEIEHIRALIPDATFIIAGDFNLPNLKWQREYPDHPLRGERLEFSDVERAVVEGQHFHDLYQVNYVTNVNGRSLDLVFTDDISVSVETSLESVLPVEGYHPPLDIIVKNHCTPLIVTEERILNYHKADFAKINDRLFTTDWTFLECLPLTDGLTEFYRILHGIVAAFVPITTFTPSKYPRWFSSELIRKINDKKAAHRLYKLSGGLSDYRRFQELRRDCRKLTDHCYRIYTESVESKVNINSKHIFKYSRSLRSDDSGLPSSMRYEERIAEAPEDMANLFADFFGNVYETLIVGPAAYHESPINVKLFSVHIEIRDIIDCIRGIEPKTSAGPDNIPPLFLKECVRGLSYPLYLIFNKSVSHGTYPEYWKQSYLIPIHKSGDKQDVSNYRPICIQSTIPKVLEKILLSKISHSLNGIITEYQHGFMPSRSTQTNLLCYENFISSSMAGRSQVDSIYTDFSKAFDRVDINILLNKLMAIGVSGSLFAWLQNYLVGRSLMVKIANKLSRPFRARSGVPQGSHLGPVLFILFLNDVVGVFKDVNILIYADDLKIYKAVNNLGDCRVLQENLNAFHDWCLENNLQLNANKCQVMRFYRIKQPFIYGYELNDTPLKSVDEVRDLGVIFDRKLSFVPHIDNISGRALRLLGFILRICRPFTNITTLRTLYVSLIRSVLEYGSAVWCPDFEVHRNKIDKIERRFLKHINYRLGIAYDDIDYGYLYEALRLQKLADRRVLLDLMTLYKIIRGQIDCREILSKINFHVPIRTTRQSLPFYVGESTTRYNYNSALNRLQRLGNEYAHSVDIYSASFISYKSSIKSALLTSVSD
jgi:hypothetical protein